MQFKKISGPLACFRLSDSGKDAKVKGTLKVGGAGSPQIPPVLFSWSRLLNSADLTISEPEIGASSPKMSLQVAYFKKPRLLLINKILSPL